MLQPRGRNLGVGSRGTPDMDQPQVSKDRFNRCYKLLDRWRGPIGGSWPGYLDHPQVSKDRFIRCYKLGSDLGTLDLDPQTLYQT